MCDLNLEDGTEVREGTSEKWWNSRYPFRMSKIRLMEIKEEKNRRKGGWGWWGIREDVVNPWSNRAFARLLHPLQLVTIKEPTLDRWNKSKRDTGPLPPSLHNPLASCIHFCYCSTNQSLDTFNCFSNSTEEPQKKIMEKNYSTFQF